MSPEYAIDGYFSVKSDVFSFGVMVLEIISGKKNKGFFHPEHQLNLLGHVSINKRPHLQKHTIFIHNDDVKMELSFQAWKLWNEGRALELIDVMLEDQFQESEALRCINIGLLCVQRRPEERPTMSTVVSMLENENMSLILPERPGFYEERFITSDIDSSLGDQLTSTSNNVTVTLLDGR